MLTDGSTEPNQTKSINKVFRTVVNGNITWRMLKVILQLYSETEQTQQVCYVDQLKKLQKRNKKASLLMKSWNNLLKECAQWPSGVEKAILSKNRINGFTSGK